MPRDLWCPPRVTRLALAARGLFVPTSAPAFDALTDTVDEWDMPD